MAVWRNGIASDYETRIRRLQPWLEDVLGCFGGIFVREAPNQPEVLILPAMSTMSAFIFLLTIVNGIGCHNTLFLLEMLPMVVIIFPTPKLRKLAIPYATRRTSFQEGNTPSTLGRLWSRLRNSCSTLSRKRPMRCNGHAITGNPVDVSGRQELVSGRLTTATLTSRAAAFTVGILDDSLDILHWLDKMLIRLFQKFANEVQKYIGSSYVFIEKYTNNSVTVIQPTLVTYTFESPAQPMLLDSVSIRPDASTWRNGARKHGYYARRYENFKELLRLPEVADTQICINVWDIVGQWSPVNFTDDVSLQVFMEHLKRLTVGAQMN
ncbi:hypothetical protein CPB84DRAFT_1750896 [Gymnopilus junonius]|uniref:Protein transport protein SEC23 n=1 Tax=Gymnopilus junonius TaxID=109634 RepID=A0A9P5NF58_GYMJU|nr:hypothetical protein CPB84DRAFT_1750896 [Gymnopilus junonius]